MGIPERDKTITNFKKIKSDLKTMYEILELNPKYEEYVKDDIANIQLMTSNALSKLKINISYARKFGSPPEQSDEKEEQNDIIS